MKSYYKHLNIIILVVIFMLIVISIANKQNNDSFKIRPFSLNEYSHIVETYQEQQNVGNVSNANDAIKVSKRLWSNKYGRINGIEYDITRGNEILVFFDRRNDCWCVKGTLNDNQMGCVPVAIIKTNGTVLAVFME